MQPFARSAEFPPDRLAHTVRSLVLADRPSLQFYGDALLRPAYLRRFFRTGRGPASRKNCRKHAATGGLAS
jgi:hypothetical protein